MDGPVLPRAQRLYYGRTMDPKILPEPAPAPRLRERPMAEDIFQMVVYWGLGLFLFAQLVVMLWLDLRR